MKGGGGERILFNEGEKFMKIREEALSKSSQGIMHFSVKKADFVCLIPGKFAKVVDAKIYALLGGTY